MIADLAKSLGIPQAVIYAVLILLGVGLLGLGKCAYDRSVIDAHDTEVNLNAAIEDRKADQKAADQAEADRQRRAYEADQLTEAMNNAPKNPAVDDERERAIAFHKCLSLQQRARANGLQPPRCV